MQPLTFLKNGPETVMNLNYYLEIKIWHRKLPKGDCKKATEQKKSSLWFLIATINIKCKISAK